MSIRVWRWHDGQRYEKTKRNGYESAVDTRSRHYFKRSSKNWPEDRRQPSNDNQAATHIIGNGTVNARNEPLTATTITVWVAGFQNTFSAWFNVWHKFIDNICTSQTYRMGEQVVGMPEILFNVQSIHCQMTGMSIRQMKIDFFQWMIRKIFSLNISIVVSHIFLRKISPSS